MTRALVCGAGGFIGWHLTKHLKNLGWEVNGVDIKYPEFAPTPCDAFSKISMADRGTCYELLTTEYDYVFQLAAEMGGVGYIHSGSEATIMNENTRINTMMLRALSSAARVGTYFFSSSVCVYPDMDGTDELSESDAVPANPNSSYGWEKVYTELMIDYTAQYLPDTRFKIGRFQNCYGPYGTWTGGKEKAPAALCRKVAMAPNNGEIEVWGDGSAIRNFIYVTDLVDAIMHLVQSDDVHLANIGTNEYMTMGEFTDLVIDISGKNLTKKYVDGPVGVQARNFSNEIIESTGWSPQFTLRQGLATTYHWIKEQIDATD